MRADPQNGYRWSVPASAAGRRTFVRAVPPRRRSAEWASTRALETPSRREAAPSTRRKCPLPVQCHACHAQIPAGIGSGADSFGDRPSGLAAEAR